MPTDFKQSLEHEIAALEGELSRDPRYLKLLKLREALVFYDTTNAAATAPVTLVEKPATSNVTVQRRAVRQPSETRVMAVERAYEHLRGRSQPTPTRDINQMLKANGISVGGTNEVSNLSALLSRDSRFHPNGRRGWVVSESEGSDDMADDDPMPQTKDRSGIDPTDTPNADTKSLEDHSDLG